MNDPLLEITGQLGSWLKKWNARENWNIRKIILEEEHK